MGVSKYLVPAFGAVAAVMAQDCSKASTTIGTGGDAQALAACKTFTGDVVIQTGAADGGRLSLDGIEKIDGKFTYDGDSTVETFSANSLETVTNDFTLNNLTSLATIDLSSFSSAGNINLKGLGALGSLGFGNPGLKQAKNLTIDNTQITSLMGVQNASQLDGISITNNPSLSAVEFSIDKVLSLLVGPNTIQGNNISLSLPNLESADIIAIRNCSSVKLPALQSTTHLFALLGNTFSSFMADNLTSCGGLVINDNTELNNMSFPALEAVNGTKSPLEIANNTKLQHIEGFGNLKLVTGSVTLSGNFSSAKFPSLNKISGAFNIDTASSSFDCSGLSTKGKVGGAVKCKTADSHPQGGSDGTGTGSGDSSESSSAAYPLEIPSNFMPIFGIIAGLLFA